MKQVVSQISHDVTYVYPLDTVFTTMAKAGSTTTWRMIFTGLTGRVWEKGACGNVQNKTSPCWQPYLAQVRDLSEDEQWRVLTSNKTLRVAIQREPFSRLISAFKNKISCSSKKFIKGLLPGHANLLRRQAGLPLGIKCMNVSEYANTLDIIRENAGNRDYFTTMSRLDEHFRPQDFYADDIYYNLVLDVSDLSNYTRINPYLDRLPYAELVRKSDMHRLNSGNTPVLMDDKTARKLHDFALLSVLAPYRYVA